MLLFAAGNPFISAYIQSDGFGKLIFWALFFLSGISWALLVYKIWVCSQVKRLSDAFASQFDESIDLLHLQFNPQK